MGNLCSVYYNAKFMTATANHLFLTHPKSGATHRLSTEFKETVLPVVYCFDSRHRSFIIFLTATAVSLQNVRNLVETLCLVYYYKKQLQVINLSFIHSLHCSHSLYRFLGTWWWRVCVYYFDSGHRSSGLYS